MANASRILPLLTSAHLPSASNHSFWPEIYTNMPMVLGGEPSPYSDTPEPRCFGTVSPLDPQTFSTIDEHGGDLLAGSANPKYSPIEVAQWMEDSATAASDALDEARQETWRAGRPPSAGLRRTWRSRWGWDGFLRRSCARACCMSSLSNRRNGRRGWKRSTNTGWRGRRGQTAAHAAAVYRSDISYGSTPMRRGHWSDRLAAIDKDIEAMTAQVQAAPEDAERPEYAAGDLAATGRPVRPRLRGPTRRRRHFSRGRRWRSRSRFRNRCWCRS